MSELRPGNAQLLLGPTGAVAGWRRQDGREQLLVTGGVACEAEGAQPDASPTANFQAIQRALNRRGSVSLTTPGVYLFNNTLVVRSGSSFHVGPGVILRQAPGTSKRLIENEALQAPATNVTVSWSAGEICTVNWTNHGFVVGEYISMFDASPSHYLGVFRIAAVVNANSFTVQLWRVPTVAPTALNGSVKAKRADVDIEIDIQGTLDYNTADSNNGAATPIDRHAAIFGHIAWLNIPHYEAINAVKYTLNIGAATEVKFNSRCSATLSDNVKIYGPVNHVTGSVTGTSSDDFISIQTKEPSAFATYIWTYGDCLDVHLNGLHCTKPSNVAGSICAIYTSPDEYMDDIIVENVSGTVPNFSPVRLQGFLDATDATGGQIGKLRFSGINARGIYQVKIDGKFTAEEIIFEDIQGSFTNLTAPMVLALNPCIIKKMTVRRPFHRDPTWPTAGTALFEIQCRVDELVVEDPNVVFANANASFVALNTANCLMDKLRIQGGRVISGSSLVRMFNSVTSNPVIEIHGVRASTLAVCNLSANARVAFSGGNRFDSVNNGAVRSDNVANVTVRSDGTNYLTSGVWIVAPAGTPTFTVYGFDIAIDPIALTQLATTPGQFCFSTQAGAEGGPSVRGPSAWYALAAGGGGANGVIA